MDTQRTAKDVLEECDMALSIASKGKMTLRWAKRDDGIFSVGIFDKKHNSKLHDFKVSLNGLHGFQQGFMIGLALK